MKSSTRVVQPDNREPGSRSRSPNAAASSMTSILVTPQQSSSLEPASSEGVVMFYNGHYADPLEWWVVGAKSVSISIFGTKAGDELEDDILEHHGHPRMGAAHCNTCIRVQSLARNSEMRYDTSRKNATPLLSSADSFEVDYDPEKDEGVHPRYLPPRNPSLRASRQAGKQTNFVGTSLKHTDEESDQRQVCDNRRCHDGRRACRST